MRLESFDNDNMFPSWVRKMVREGDSTVSGYIASLYNDATSPYTLRLDFEHDYCRRVANILRKWRKRYSIPVKESDSSGRWYYFNL